MITIETPEFVKWSRQCETYRNAILDDVSYGECVLGDEDFEPTKKEVVELVLLATLRSAKIPFGRSVPKMSEPLPEYAYCEPCQRADPKDDQPKCRTWDSFSSFWETLRRRPEYKNVSWETLSKEERYGAFTLVIKAANELLRV